MTQVEDIDRVCGKHPGFRFIEPTDSAKRIANLKLQREANNRALCGIWVAYGSMVAFLLWALSRVSR